MFGVHSDVPFTMTEAGTHETVIDGVAVVVEELPPPQEFKASSAGRNTKLANKRGHLAPWRRTEPLG